MTTQDEQAGTRIRFEILRLITPALIGVLGTLCLMQITQIEKTLDETSKAILTLNSSMSQISADVQAVKERVERDEDLYDGYHRK